MNGSASIRPREQAVDALRALALLSVICVNLSGYASLPEGGPLAPPLPPDSGLAHGLTVLIATLLQGKGYSLLAFLFGYSQALSWQARGPDALVTRRRRMFRLLMLGLAHGSLIYMGDILTSYALCGLIMVRWPAQRLNVLLRRWYRLLAASLALLLGLALASASSVSNGMVNEASASLATPVPALQWLLFNATEFSAVQLGVTLFALPMFLCLMLGGLIAGRLRLFSHRRWRGLLRTAVKHWLLPGLLVNLLLGLLQVYFLVHAPDAALLLASLSAVFAPLMLLGLVPWLVQKFQDGDVLLHRLVPAGRFSLSMYLSSSLLGLLLFSGAGLSWQLGTVAVTVLALVWWGLWLVVATALQARGQRLPPEAWLAAR